MGFIQLVTDRVHKAHEFTEFKNLLTSYNLCIQNDIVAPKVYLVLSSDEADNVEWQSLPNRLPNIFTVRPSIFLNNKHDYMLRDDGGTIRNFTIKTHDTLQNIYDQQVVASRNIGGSSIVFEEFPLVDDILQYPTHYRLHTFCGGVALTQIVTADGMIGWFNIKGKMLATTDQVNLDSYIPKDNDMEVLMDAGKRLSLATRQAYIRIDFVLSTRGPMFRSFACIPGDVRSKAFASFYEQVDQQLAEEWSAAEQRINNSDNTTPKIVAQQVTPDDN